MVLNMMIVELRISLMGKFLAFFPSLDLVKKWVSSKWKLKGSITTSVMAYGLYLFSFTNQVDMACILMDGPWAYDSSNYLSLCKWKPNLDPWLDLGVVAPTWICLPSLPLEF